LIIAILVKPVSGTLKRNENRYVPGNRLQEKQTITTITLPEKQKFNGCKFLGFCSHTVMSLFLWDVPLHHWVSLRPPLCLENSETNYLVMW
jgi:hypothetical protein